MKSRLFVSYLIRATISIMTSALLASFGNCQELNEIELQPEANTPGDLVTSIPGAFKADPYVEIGGSFSHLSNNYNNWNGQYVNLTVPMKDSGLISGQFDNLNRFRTTDQNYDVNYAYPFLLGVINVEGTYSPNPNFMPEHSIALGWDGKLPVGFGYILGVNQKQYGVSYSNASTNMYNLGIEKYFGEYRIAYTGALSTINQIDSSYSQKLEAQWIGNNNNRIGFNYTWGITPTVIYLSQLGSYQIRYVSLSGLYWIASNAALTGSVLHGMEGSYYQLNGAQLGLRISF